MIGTKISRMPLRQQLRAWRERQSRTTAEMRELWIADILAHKAEKVKPRQPRPCRPIDTDPAHLKPSDTQLHRSCVSEQV